MQAHGFLRVAAATPELRLADPKFNAERTLDLLREAEDSGVDVVVFPECGLTGYTHRKPQFYFPKIFLVDSDL